MEDITDLNMEDITDADCNHAKKVWKKGEYHDFYIQWNKCLLADSCKTFWNLCFKIHRFNSANSSTPSGVA